MADEKKKNKAAGKDAKGKDAKGKAAPAKKGAQPAVKGGKGVPEAKAESKSRRSKSEGAAPEILTTPPRMQEMYRDQVVPALTERFKYSNPMQVPRLTKIVVNMGVGEGISNSKAVDSAVDDLAQITGQQPSIRKARISVSNFKLRAGMPVGAAVTLRRRRMWEFMDRLLTFAMPRIRDFRGIPKRGFDGRGNFSLGLKEQLIFPEIDFDSVEQVRGMNICVVTTAKTDEEAYELLSGLGMPFTKEG